MPECTRVMRFYLAVLLVGFLGCFSVLLYTTTTISARYNKLSSGEFSGPSRCDDRNPARDYRTAEKRSPGLQTKGSGGAHIYGQNQAARNASLQAVSKQDASLIQGGRKSRVDNPDGSTSPPTRLKTPVAKRSNQIPAAHLLGGAVNSPVTPAEVAAAVTLGHDATPHLLSAHALTKIWPTYNRTSATSQAVGHKLLLLYNLPQYVTANVPSDLEKCEVRNCEATTNTSLLPKAGAVMFQLQWLSDPQAPQGRPPGQIWIGLGMEPPVNYRSSYDKESWKGAFNWTVSYREDSDLFDPYSLLKPNANPAGKNYTLIALRKNRTAAWFVGHCTTHSKREEFIRRMQALVRVDTYGRCGPYVCPKSKGRECNAMLNTVYRFYLSFQNSFCRDYVTEKLFNIFGGLDIVPVVRGGANYKKLLPPGTYIDAADFKSPEDLARYLQHLETDVAAYSEYLRRKDQYRTVSMRPLVFCKLCEMLHFDKRVQSYPDLPKWTSDGVCKKPSDL